MNNNTDWDEFSRSKTVVTQPWSRRVPLRYPVISQGLKCLLVLPIRLRRTYNHCMISQSGSSINYVSPCPENKASCRSGGFHEGCVPPGPIQQQPAPSAGHCKAHTPENHAGGILQSSLGATRDLRKFHHRPWLYCRRPSLSIMWHTPQESPSDDSGAGTEAAIILTWLCARLTIKKHESFF